MTIASALTAAVLLGQPAVVALPDGGAAFTPDARHIEPMPLLDTLAWPNDLPAVGAVPPPVPPPKPQGWPAGTWPPLRWSGNDAALDYIEWVLGGERPKWLIPDP